LEELTESGEMPPRHTGCGGVYKPDVVLFGDPMPPEIDDCYREVSGSDLLLVVGSSLEVSPVNYLPNLCRSVVIMNLGPTMGDWLASLKIEAKAGEAFAMLREVLEGRGVKLK